MSCYQMLRVLRLVEDLTSCNKDNIGNFSGEKSTMKLSGVSIFREYAKRTLSQISYSQSFSSPNLKLSIVETIFLKIWAKPLPRKENVHFRWTSVAQKRLCLSSLCKFEQLQKVLWEFYRFFVELRLLRSCRLTFLIVLKCSVCYPSLPLERIMVSVQRSTGQQCDGTWADATHTVVIVTHYTRLQSLTPTASQSPYSALISADDFYIMHEMQTHTFFSLMGMYFWPVELYSTHLLVTQILLSCV